MASTSDAPTTPAEVKAKCDAFRDRFARLRAEIGKVVVGHADVVEGVLIALLFVGSVRCV